MGREIRRVPKDWEHPRDKQDHYKPLYDSDYETAAEDWLARLMKWERGEDPDREKYDYRYYWDWHLGPPDEDYYRLKWKEEPTCYQIYETVSEGTPTSPVFPSLDEMRAWLVKGGYSEESAEAFVEHGWVPSMWTRPGKGIIMGIEAAAELYGADEQ